MKFIRNTQYAIDFTHHASRLTHHASRLNSHTLTGLILFAAGLYAYTTTLAPTVLEGDKALFQYTPYVLGVTYPTGFPLYILLGKVWLTIFPFGEIAWRMNLLSALCSAAALPLLYNAIRRLLSPPWQGGAGGGSRWAALTAVVTFATLPTFWHWSTVAKTYPLNILLLATALYFLALASEKQQKNLDHPSLDSSNSHPQSRITFLASPLALPALLLGLQISVHNTAVLLLPGLLLFAWLHFRPYLLNKKLFVIHTLLLIIPGLFYLYVPLRAEWLIAQYGRLGAIEHGLLADFYSGLDGLAKYFTAAEFTGGIVTKWGLIPQRFLTVYVPLLVNVNNLTPLVIGLGVIGGLAMAILRPRIFWPLLLIYLVPIPFVLTYDQGEQSAFLLPSFLIFSIFIGNTLALVDQLLATRLTHHTSRPVPRGGCALPAFRVFTFHVSRFTSHVSRFTSPLLFLILIPLLFIPQIRHNYNWLEVKWSKAAQYDEWNDNLNHPLQPGATMLAQWGDLTSLWYMQYAENRRPDLRGLYPPTEETITNWFAAGGNNLYIAGKLQDWPPGLQEHYQLLPWGRLVRLAPRHIPPETLLPTLPHPIEAIFTPVDTGDNELRLIGVDYPLQAVGGSDYAVTLTWQALTDLPPETTVSLRLSQEEAIVVQLDDTLLSGWFPRDALPAGQHVLSYAPIPLPLGTLPGKYRLQLVTYTHHKYPWTIVNGSTLLDLGEVEVVSPPADYQPPSSEATIPGHDFNGELELVDYQYSVSRVGQGKGFAVKLLWHALNKPVDSYTLLVEAVDAGGNVLRSVEHQPGGGRAPMATWQAGQFVRDQVDLVLPAGAPSGQKAVRVRLSWLRPDGSKLKVRRWFIPLGDNLNLDWLAVVEKEGRVFEVPQVQYSVDVNLDNKVRLIGYDLSPASPPSLSAQRIELQMSQQDCAAAAEACRIHFDFYWQGLAEMEELYLTFLHVVDEQGQIVTQHDRPPGKRGKQPTTGWLPGEVVADPIDLRLPPDVIPGQYTIYLGMYQPPDGTRLFILDDEGQPVADFIEVGTIKVTP